MDKNEYNLKLIEIDKCIDQENYEEAAHIADQIEWKRVRNVRTLCKISEVYEAANRYEDSKALLLRAYRRSPVGRSILYRLVEITIKLKQFDEAIEYYSEYVQAAPHDNNRLLLKYKIYRGRGSSLQEQILILKEYLDQEYSEKYVYELAKLYLEADSIQECLAACDDLVLWFQSGPYVKKALDLKMKYASLTDKQKVIYDREVEREEEEALGREKSIVQTADTDEANAIIEDTAKDIAKAVQESIREREEASIEESGPATIVIDDAQRQKIREQMAAAAAGQGAEVQAEEPVKEAEESAEEETSAAEPQETPISFDTTQLQTDVIKEVRELTSGVGLRDQVDPDEEAIDEVIEASKKDQEEHVLLSNRLRIPRRSAKTSAGKVSIDDVLLSMGSKGDAVRQAVEKAGAHSETRATGVLSAVDEALLSMGVEPETVEKDTKKTKISDSMEEIRFTGIPIPGLDERMKKEESVETEETAEAENREEAVGEQTENAGADEADLTVAEENAEPESAADEAEPEENIAEDTDLQQNAPEEETEPADETAVEDRTEDDEENIPEETPDPAEDTLQTAPSEEEVPEDIREEADREEVTQDTAEWKLPEADESSEDEEQPAAEEEQNAAPAESVDDDEPLDDEDDTLELEDPAGAETADEMTMDEAMQARTRRIPRGELKDKDKERAESSVVRRIQKRTIPYQVRDLFKGFITVEGLENQIALALAQALDKTGDRTSRSGNVMITGGHGSGKTTIATAIAKAVAQLQGKDVLRMARIYATNLNRKDIAATIAKIAGGILIIEEAGDLEDAIADQLTTAMEFRTDGLIIILEDEQKYLNELLMRHPRLAMKFNARVNVPHYKVEELVLIAQEMVGASEYAVSEEAQDALAARLEEMEKQEEVSLIVLKEICDQAVKRAGKFSRRVFGGKKRFDEEGRIILQAKDFA